MGAGTYKLKAETPSPLPATQLLERRTPEPWWEAEILLLGNQLKRKKIIIKEEAPVQRRSCYMAQPHPQRSHLPLNSRAQSRILRHPRTASSKKDRNQKQRGENKLFREKKKLDKINTSNKKHPRFQAERTGGHKHRAFTEKNAKCTLVRTQQHT